MTAAADVSRSESTTERFGRVITYSVQVDDVRFQAERMVGLDDDYAVSCHVGRCGMSFHRPNVGGRPARIAGGRGVRTRLAELADQVYAAGNVMNPTHADRDSRSAKELCCDRPACDRYRPLTS